MNDDLYTIAGDCEGYVYVRRVLPVPTEADFKRMWRNIVKRIRMLN
jgi:hypothetical protein